MTLWLAGRLRDACTLRWPVLLMVSRLSRLYSPQPAVLTYSTPHPCLYPCGLVSRVNPTTGQTGGENRHRLERADRRGGAESSVERRPHATAYT